MISEKNPNFFQEKIMWFLVGMM